MSATAVLRELTQHEIEYELLAHDRTERAAEEAAALGVTAEDVGKTLIVVTPGGRVRAVIPANERLDLHKVRAALDDGKEIRLATEDELARAYPMFELGAVPPFGGPPSEAVLVDRRLAARESVVVEAGTHRDSVRVRTADLRRVTAARVTDLVRD